MPHAQHDRPNQKNAPFFWVDALHKRAPKLAQSASAVACQSTIAAQSVLMSAPLYACGAMKLAGRRFATLKDPAAYADKGVIAIADRWIATNNWLIDRVLPSKDWRIRLPDDLDVNKQYLLVCNHQSWVDTSVVQYIGQGRLPLTRFFAKRELLYIPIVGQTFYLLDFPMMRRHSKEAIAKNPRLAGQDLAQAERACRLLMDKPFALLNYLEGTRFTAKKHGAQHSPYAHLLKPKAGGLALALATFGDKLDGILDMTIVYPDGAPSYNDFWAGKARRLAVDLRRADMEADLCARLKRGQYARDAKTKSDLHQWLDALWQQKDRRIDALLKQFDDRAPS